LQDHSGTVYNYDTGNRLVQVVQGGTTYTFGYNGLGDRLRQVEGGAVTTYTLDLNTGLTQVLNDGTNTYLYPSASSGQGCLGRIGEEQPGGWAYHLPDALGSVRQMTDEGGTVTLAQFYESFGEVLESVGTGATTHSFAGECKDAYMQLIPTLSPENRS
jgi:YD repeat-containing protein